jgi:hypothetical protein
MTVVKYNNCESIGQNTTEYQPDRRYLGWVGEIITSVRLEVICGNMNMDAAPYLYCAIDDSVMLDLHNIFYDHVIFSMTMSSVKFCSLLWLSRGGYQRLCSSLIIIIIINV